MHATHLAANVACLEILLEFGADFAARDTQGRTPLFVACAMNRVECASFLLEVLELQDVGMGDGPGRYGLQDGMFFARMVVPNTPSKLRRRSRPD